MAGTLCAPRSPPGGGIAYTPCAFRSSVVSMRGSRPPAPWWGKKEVKLGFQRWQVLLNVLWGKKVQVSFFFQNQRGFLCCLMPDKKRKKSISRIVTPRRFVLVDACCLTPNRGFTPASNGYWQMTKERKMPWCESCSKSINGGMVD